MINIISNHFSSNRIVRLFVFEILRLVVSFFLIDLGSSQFTYTLVIFQHTVFHHEALFLLLFPLVLHLDQLLPHALVVPGGLRVLAVVVVVAGPLGVVSGFPVIVDGVEDVVRGQLLVGVDLAEDVGEVGDVLFVRDL